MKSSELDRISHLSRLFAPAEGGAPAPVIVAIGDDAAVIAPAREPLVWTVDAAVEGTHFRRAWLSFEDIGYRSAMAAMSDLAAMAAEPLGVLSSLVLPDDVSDTDLYALAAGQRAAAAALGTAVIGGNLARGRELSITTTALGRAAAPLLRKGAAPGDALFVLGSLGLAAAGLRFLMRDLPHDSADAAASVAAWRRPLARVKEALALRGVATAAIDVSDGLATDAAHLAAASGARVVIDLGALTAATDGAETLRGAAALLGVSPEDLALFGGEDYAVLFTAPAGASVANAARIGSIEALDAEGEGAPALVQRPDGSRAVLRRGGFDHFS